ncbi:MAG TPA: hypothetical protein VFZ21_27480 [Gemmatimonadaceae bacterium]|jgi:hypothetical protein|nr:hypothetical protein [Gemmatimonadaceae bacterium]
MRLTFQTVVLFLSAISVACTHRSPATLAGAPAARDSSPNYAIQQAYRDSVERATVGRFLTEYQQRARPLQQAGNYLGEMQLVRELAAKYPDSKSVRDMSTQQLGTFASFLGDQAEAVRLFDTLADGSPAPQADTALLAQLRVSDAVETISGAADSTRVIFINEAHHVPQTRLLTLALLEPLRAKGFTHLAAETLSPFDSSLNARDYPVRGSGYYSNEPLFGEVLREARRLGYVLVPYEAMGSTSQDARETGQATNLRDRIFRDRPDARVLVHAGYSHINESGTLAGAKPMAVRFRELTGIDPLTIDQTSMYEHSSRAREDPIYRHVLDRPARTTPFVLVDAEGRPWTNRPGVHDVTVFLPRTQLRDGRPDWLWRAGARRPYVVRGSSCSGHEVCVVAARLEAESADAVPRDVVLLRPGDAGRTLALPAGRYVITIRDPAGAMLSDTTVTVPPG